VNFEFEAKMATNPHLKFLSSKMFFICDGNYQFKARTCYINKLYRNDQQWHYSMDNICFDTKGKGSLLLNAMHDIDK
jgi:hypothetical protein